MLEARPMGVSTQMISGASPESSFTLIKSLHWASGEIWKSILIPVSASNSFAKSWTIPDVGRPLWWLPKVRVTLFFPSLAAPVLLSDPQPVTIAAAITAAMERLNALFIIFFISVLLFSTDSHTLSTLVFCVYILSIKYVSFSVNLS